MINKDTQLCISVSHYPSNFGTTLHNKAYDALNLNFIYKAFQTNDIVNVLNGVKALNIRGCSVSMPFKETIIPYLDILDSTASSVGSVNTVLNENGCLIGYNTDVIGARIVLDQNSVQKSDNVLILGAGGVSRAVIKALLDLGVTDITIANRTIKGAEDLSKKFNLKTCRWNNLNEISSNIIINATSIGMLHTLEELPIPESLIERTRLVMDVVVRADDTEFIKHARSCHLNVIRGYEMSLEQAIAQFEIYTGHNAPRQIMRDAMYDLLNINDR
jgi:shikimate dehydrogenase